MAWFKPNILAAGTNIFLSFTLPYLSFHSSGNQAFHSSLIGGIQRNIQGPTVVTPGNWYLVTGTYDGSSLKVYLNGNLDSSLAVSGIGAVTSNTLCVGAHTCNSYWTNGAVDDVRIYNRALSAAEIQRIYRGTE
jgi:hypothetical protein